MSAGLEWCSWRAIFRNAVPLTNGYLRRTILRNSSRFDVTDDDFRPAWWLPGAHLQTLWGKFFKRLPEVPASTERLETNDGDFLELHRLPGGADAPRLLILHGLEGSPRSHYARGMLSLAHRAGWPADVLVFRSCGTEMNRLPRFYHSGETSDLDWVVRRLLDAEPDRELVLTGISLGGNVLLKWLGESGASLPARVRGAVAVSVPYDLHRGALYIDQGFSRLYQWNFMRSLRAKALLKSRSHPERLDDEKISAARTLVEFDDAVTAPLHGFEDAVDYYTRCSSIRFIEHIRLPTLLLSAVDDPFLPPSVLDEVREIAHGNPAVSLEFVNGGGHVGFVAGTPWQPHYWAEHRVLRYLNGLVGTEARER